MTLPLRLNEPLTLNFVHSSKENPRNSLPQLHVPVQKSHLNWPQKSTKSIIFRCYWDYGNQTLKLILEAPRDTSLPDAMKQAHLQFIPDLLAGPEP